MIIPAGRPRHMWEDNLNMGLKRNGVWCCELAESISVMGSYEHGNEPSGSIKGEEFSDCLIKYQLLKI